MSAELGTTAGAVSNATMNWHDIEWEKVHRNVRRLQARIVKATQDYCWETASCSARRLRCLSRVKGDFHARFLGGWGPAMAPGYPTARRNRGPHAINRSGGRMVRGQTAQQLSSPLARQTASAC